MSGDRAGKLAKLELSWNRADVKRIMMHDTNKFTNTVITIISVLELPYYIYI